MRRFFLLSVFLSSAVFFGCSNQSPVSATGSENSTVAVTASVWNGYNQSQKDMTIFSVAMACVGQANNNCKEWVRSTVSTASGGVVTIPGTAKNKYSWEALPSNIVNRNVTDIANVAPMDIIQMYYYPGVKFGWTAHTAIVVSKNSTQMTWVDANFIKNAAGVMIVSTHDVTFAQFRSWSPSGSGFTVYHVQ